MTISVFWTMFWYLIVGSFAPGPGNLLAWNATTGFGWKKAKNLIIGICCGYICVQFICTVAVYTMSTYMAPALAVLKYIGGAYICWLAISIIRSKPEEGDNRQTPSFYTGFMLQFVNVKIYFFIMTVLTTYLVPYYPALNQLLTAGIGVVAIGCLATLTWALCGTKMQDVYKRKYKLINVIMGVFLIYCAWNIIRS